MMGAFSQNQDRMRQSMQETFGGMFPFGNLEEMGKQNMALFESAMRMFSPFNQPGETPEEAGKAAPEKESEDLSAMREELDAMRAKLDQILDKKK
jgi:polyhydroxyalkanoate synthesis regulator protein